MESTLNFIPRCTNCLLRNHAVNYAKNHLVRPVSVFSALKDVNGHLARIAMTNKERCALDSCREASNMAGILFT